MKLDGLQPGLALAAMFLFIATASNRAQPSIIGHASNFTSNMYFEAPNERQVKMRLSGAEALPLPGGLLDVRQLKIEKFNATGKLEATVLAPQCTLAPLDGVASSAGPLELVTGDGKFRVTGEGFLWRQEGSSLTISNNVHTVIQIGNFKLPGL